MKNCSHNLDQLIQSAVNNDVQLMKELIDDGIDVNCSTSDGRNALCVGARLGHAEVVEVLLDAHCQINIIDLSDEVWKRQAIHLAASKGNQVCICVFCWRHRTINFLFF